MYVYTYTGIITGFLLNKFLTHFALVCGQVYMVEYVCNVSSLLIKTAQVVHTIITILPPETIDAYEKEELEWEPRSKSCSTVCMYTPTVCIYIYTLVY